MSYTMPIFSARYIRTVDYKWEWNRKPMYQLLSVITNSPRDLNTASRTLINSLNPHKIRQRKMAHHYKRSKSAPMGHLYQALQHPVQTLEGLEEESVRLLMQEVSSDPNSKEQILRSSRANPTNLQNLNAGYCTNGAIKRSDEPDADELLLTLTDSVAILRRRMYTGATSRSRLQKTRARSPSLPLRRWILSPTQPTCQINYSYFTWWFTCGAHHRSPTWTHIVSSRARSEPVPSSAARAAELAAWESSRVRSEQRACKLQSTLAAHAATGAGGPEGQSPNRREDTGPERNRDCLPHVTLQMLPTDLSTAPIRKQRVLAWLASHKGVICCVVLIAFFFGLSYFVGRHSVYKSNALGVSCHCGSANAS